MRERRIDTCRFLLDANCINARQADASLNQLEAWHKNSVIQILMSEPSSKEAAAGGDPSRARKAFSYIKTSTLLTTAEEQETLRKIEAILVPGGSADENQRYDIEIVFNAKKYGLILLTTDGGSRRQPGGILGNAGRLCNEVGIRVMRPQDAVARVRDEIRKRDAIARKACESAREPLPGWVGQD